MTCWHCSKELDFVCMTKDVEKFYHCAECDKWYEMSKEKGKINSSVPVRFFELESRPQIQPAMAMAA
jgi:hypothetical protein